MNKYGIVRPYQSMISFVQQLTDFIVIGAVFHILTSFFGVQWEVKYTIAVLVSSTSFYVIARHLGLYSSWRGQSITLEILEVTKAWIGAAFILALLAFTYKVTDHFSRKLIATWLITTPLTLSCIRIAVRLALRNIRSQGRNTRTVAIAGSGHLANALYKNIMAMPWFGIKIAGFYSDNLEQDSEGSELNIIGDLNQLIQDAKLQKYDEIYIALPIEAHESIRFLVQKLADAPCQVHFLPDVFTFNLINSRYKDIGGLPIISVYDSPLDSVGSLVKRIEDLLLGLFLFSLSALPMLLIAMSIKLTSKGPVFFKQRRYGLNGEEIWVWKFRTMNVCEDGAEITQAKKTDSRITTVGKVLRRTSLDELPQFINVLQGSMSIVGPRPHAIAHNELYRLEIDGYMQRHLVKPGITGWAQINGWRGETDTLEKMEKRVEHDLHYIKNWSLWLDFKIILLTIIKGFTDKNAY